MCPKGSFFLFHPLSVAQKTEFGSQVAVARGIKSMGDVAGELQEIQRNQPEQGQAKQQRQALLGLVPLYFL